MNVVYAATRNLYPYLRTTIRSLFEYNDPETVYLMIEDDAFPYALPDVCKAVNVSGQTWIDKAGPNAKSIFTYMAMCRACYTKIFPDEDKLIQLDVDTIVCDSIQPLWDIDLTGKWLAACQEYKGRYKPWGEKYYNVGVSVHNLAQMREDGITDIIVNECNQVRMWCTEQDAFNKWGLENDKFVDIPVRFNECFATGETDNPAIVHYAGVPDWYNNPKLHRREYLERWMR